MYEWANISGEYKRNRNDFLRLCRTCHRRFDWNEEKTKQAVKNLSWVTKTIRISKYGKVFNESY